MNLAELIGDISSLPPEAQKEVIDFVAFLKTRYPIPKNRNSTSSEEPFIGMWKDRKDMQDSTAWVRDLRRKEWREKF
jgi:hypothetical protein